MERNGSPSIMYDVLTRNIVWEEICVDGLYSIKFRGNTEPQELKIRYKNENHEYLSYELWHEKTGSVSP